MVEESNITYTFEYSEPLVIKAGVRDSKLDDGTPIYDIECRFNNGEKFAAIQVDYEFPELAFKISNYLNSMATAPSGFNSAT